MEGERVVFTEEGTPPNYLKLVASGEIDDSMLEALESYVNRQKKRLGLQPQTTIRAREQQVSDAVLRERGSE